MGPDRSEGGAGVWASLPGANARNNFLRQVGSQWFNNDPAAAVDWLKGLPDDSSKMQLVESVSFQWAQNDLSSAMDYVGSMPAAAPRIT